MFEFLGALYIVKDAGDKRYAYCTEINPNARVYNTEYYYFSADIRPKLNRENPNRKPGYVNSLISLEWRRLSADQREYYRRKKEENRSNVELQCRGRLKFRKVNGADELLEYTEHKLWCGFSVTNGHLAELAKQQARNGREIRCRNSDENGQVHDAQVIDVEYLPGESSGLKCERKSSWMDESSELDEFRVAKLPGSYIDCELLTEQEYRELMERKPITTSEPTTFRPPEID